jgi:hypothetical protein
MFILIRIPYHNRKLNPSSTLLKVTNFDQIIIFNHIIWIGFLLFSMPLFFV